MFFPNTIPFPKIDLDNSLHQTSSDIITILKVSNTALVPPLKAGDLTYKALLKVATILKLTDHSIKHAITNKRIEITEESKTTLPITTTTIKPIPKFSPVSTTLLTTPTITPTDTPSPRVTTNDAPSPRMKIFDTRLQSKKTLPAKIKILQQRIPC